MVQQQCFLREYTDAQYSNYRSLFAVCACGALFMADTSKDITEKICHHFHVDTFLDPMTLRWPLDSTDAKTTNR